MAYDAKFRSEQPPEYWGNRRDPGQVAEHSRKVAQSVRSMLNGSLNNHFQVTLEAGETVTTIPFTRAKVGMSVLITPCNAAAAAFARSNDVWGTTTGGEIQVNHDASAAGTETFSVVVFG